MKVLVACEYSGVVRDAFIDRGHDAVSCDLLPTEKAGPHCEDDVLEYIRQSHGFGWDLMIAHPPCTYLSNSGVKHLYKGGNKANGIDVHRMASMVDAARFFKKLWDADIPRIAVENPIMHGYGKELIGTRQTQVIQPWQFGHGEIKATCLWLKNLPPLAPTNVVDGREARVHKLPPSADRWKLRSTTLTGIASAMAEQWGGF